MKLVPVDSDEHWKSLRAKHVGGSEIAALFDRSPYFTRFMLWHDKAGKVPLPEPDNDRVWWGKKLEPIIAERVSAQMRWQLEACKVYCVAETTEGMGCTVDRFVIDHERGPGVVEIKDVDWLEHRRLWTETHAPAHIELQLQHQLAVTGFEWGAIACFVKGSSNDVLIYERKPEPAVMAEIVRAVTDFWRSVHAGEAPEPFGAVEESETLRVLYPRPEPEKFVDLTGDAEAFELARQLAWAKTQYEFHAGIADHARLKLLAKIGDAHRVIIPGINFRRTKSGAIKKCERIEGVTPVFAGPDFSFI